MSNKPAGNNDQKMSDIASMKKSLNAYRGHFTQAIKRSKSLIESASEGTKIETLTDQHSEWPNTHQ